MCAIWDFTEHSKTTSAGPLFDMLVLRIRIASPWMIISLLALLVVCSGARDRPRSKRLTRSPSGPNRGKFNLKEGMQCTWATKDVGEVVKLTVECGNPKARIHGGVTDLQCEYRAKPRSCPGYESNAKGFYRQVSRALKKLGKQLCRDERKVVKAGMCRRAPRDAHFKLDFRTAVVSAQSGGEEDFTPPLTRPPSTTRSTTATSTSTAPSGTPADCNGRANHRQAAHEYCGSSWASVCAFFFSMLQSEDC